MKFPSTLPALALATSTALAAAIPQTTQLDQTKTIFQADKNGTQFENIAVRPDGTILATRIDVPEVFLIDPFTGKAEVIITIPGDVAGVLGITEVYSDVYAINAGNVTSAGIIKGSFQVWELDLQYGYGTAKASLITKIPEAGLLNGIATLNADTVLTADSNPGRIWQVNIKTGQYSVLIQDPSMSLPANATSPAGINGLRIADGYVYFTNSAQMQFNRYPIHPDGSSAGKIQPIAGGFPMDDFAVLDDGTAYLVTSNHNQLNKVTLDGTVVTIAGTEDSLALGGGTSAQFGRTPLDKSTIYVTTSGDRSSPINGTLMEPAKVAAVKLSRGGSGCVPRI